MKSTWLIYGLGLGVALLCDFFGIMVFFQNKVFGGATGSNFGDFLAATRNPELNELNLNEPGRIRLKYCTITTTSSQGVTCHHKSSLD
jgi:hypothetical protein